MSGEGAGTALALRPAVARLFRLAPLLVAITAAGVFSVACGTGSRAGNASDAAAGTAGSAGAAGGNVSAGDAGGANRSGSSSGGSAAGTSGSSAGTPGGCRTAADCQQNNPTGIVPTVSQCLSPGQAPPAASCGAPGWCGQCNCGPQPQAPLGNGMPCQTSADCPAQSPDVATASVCELGSCTQCATSADCPAEAPACGSAPVGFLPPFRQCLECAADTDCPSTKPHCAWVGMVAKCFACASDADCATGICSGGACAPGCSAEAPCPSALTSCGALQRCEPLRCQGGSACPTNAACLQGVCARRTCANDRECDSGGCVNGLCHETLGSCHTQTFPP